MACAGLWIQNSDTIGRLGVAGHCFWFLISLALLSHPFKNPMLNLTEMI